MNIARRGLSVWRSGVTGVLASFQIHYYYIDYYYSLIIYLYPQEFSVLVTEELIEHCMEGALSMEVWGHRSTGFVLYLLLLID